MVNARYIETPVPVYRYRTDAPSQLFNPPRFAYLKQKLKLKSLKWINKTRPRDFISII